MTDRDHFAAAAFPCCHEEIFGEGRLTGYPSDWRDQIVRQAYAYADAMLRERERTNHDAAPAARADSTDDRTDKAAPSQCRDGTGDTWFPLWNPKPGEILPKAVIGLAYDEYLREPVTKVGDGKTAWKDLPKMSALMADWITRTPDWLRDSPVPVAQSAEQPFCKRPVAGSTPAGGSDEPVAWAYHDGDEFVSATVEPKTVANWRRGKNEIVPLYRHPPTCPHVRGTVTQYCSLNFTLTDAEREAVEWAESHFLSDYEQLREPCDKERAATLRGLLERTKGGGR